MKDFSSRWGYSYKEIMSMDRKEFCAIHGEKYLEMSYCQFKSMIRRETPYMDLVKYKNNLKWDHDRLVNKIEHKAVQSGGWDFEGQGEIL